ncbi:MAG: hypothetical protein NW214_12575 [Pseudanabaenaceae cyanobacterium bins.39]|nr:hypothetical protein [Pseudanabaenaceae cyanobacterium bins.39]
MCGESVDVLGDRFLIEVRDESLFWCCWFVEGRSLFDVVDFLRGDRFVD